MACYALEMTLYLVHIDRGAKQHYPAPRALSWARSWRLRSGDAELGVVRLGLGFLIGAGSSASGRTGKRVRDARSGQGALVAAALQINLCRARQSDHEFRHSGGAPQREGQGSPRKEI